MGLRRTERTHLGGLFGRARLALRKGRRRGLAASLFGRLSLRRERISETCSPKLSLNSRETADLLHCDKKSATQAISGRLILSQLRRLWGLAAGLEIMSLGTQRSHNLSRLLQNSNTCSTDCGLPFSRFCCRTAMPKVRKLRERKEIIALILTVGLSDRALAQSSTFGSLL